MFCILRFLIQIKLIMKFHSYIILLLQDDKLFMFLLNAKETFIEVIDKSFVNIEL